MTMADYNENDAQISYAAVCMIDDPDDGSFLEEGEVECADCGCHIILDPERPAGAQRCDTDEAHHTETCGEDCQVICGVCLDHHFAPYCGGASRSTLQSRETYGGRKGRSATRRLTAIYRKLDAKVSGCERPDCKC